ncbi:universal stress protein [Fulvivirga sp.]|uniref:universal stress protein n=1 Tax=Fulvivirga sp. TaxID=1931237 RepID=UPI0032EBDEBE
MRIKKILVPINYSDCSINALRYAGQLAKQFEAKLLIIHALDNGNILTSKMVEEQKQRHIEKISAILDNEPNVSSIINDILITEKTPKDAIYWAIDEFYINLIIMGTEGAHRPFDELVGSFTYHVISNSKLPLLTIPENCPYIPPHKIGFGVDYKLLEHTSTLDILLDLVYAYNSKLEIFHVKTSDTRKNTLEIYESTKLDDYFSGVNHEFQTIEHSSIMSGLSSYINKNKPDLMAIMPRKYNFFKWLWHDSVSKELVQHLPLPILTIPEK